eukprot:888866-Rhodomonas_salina.4
MLSSTIRNQSTGHRAVPYTAAVLHFVPSHPLAQDRVCHNTVRDLGTGHTRRYRSTAHRIACA